MEKLISLNVSKELKDYLENKCLVEGKSMETVMIESLKEAIKMRKSEIKKQKRLLLKTNYNLSRPN